MDSPPPTQVPLRDHLMDLPRSVHLPPSPTPPNDSANNSFGSPSHNSGGLSARDRDNDLVNLPNGHSNALSSHAYTLAHAHAMALHNHNLMAAHAHSAMRHGVGSHPLNQIMRKTLMPHKSPGGPYRSPPPVPPHAGPPGADANACSLITYREQKVAAFQVDGRELICLPQAFELFLKDLVGGLHTVYTKLKRLDIQPVVCNVEQVRILRGLGAIQPGVNRCKLISCSEFDVLYEDCTNSNARPGRPPKRNPTIQASPETLEKLKKSRMDGSDFNYDARYFGVPGDHKMLNGFSPSAYPYPYMPMGVNPMITPPMSAAMLHFMRADAAANKEGKAIMDQELINRQNQLSIFGAPPLPEHSLASRHPDADPNKPMNLSNGNTRAGLHLPAAPNVKISSDDDDEDDDIMNDDKISDDDNDADMDDNSNDVSDGYNGSGDLDKPAITGVPRQDLPLLNGSHVANSSSPSEVEQMLLNVIELTQKAFNAVRVSQVQLGQDKENIQDELLREKELRKLIEKKFEEEQKKAEALEKRWRKEKKARRQLQLQVEGNKPGSPEPNGHNPNNALTTAADMGLDLAMKTMPSPEDTTRTQNTDAVESETEGEKNAALSDSERKLSGPLFIDTRRREEVHSE